MTDPVNEETMKARREELNTLIDDLNKQKAQYERELTAISLYLDAMKAVMPTSEVPKSESKSQRSPSGPRAPRGERRGIIFNILKQKPDGYTFNSIIEIMGVNDDHEKKAVYSTLQNMKRKEEIVQNSNKHFLVPPTGEKASEPVRAEAEQP
jgi:hypothetical protein